MFWNSFPNYYQEFESNFKIQFLNLQNLTFFNPNKAGFLMVNFSGTGQYDPPSPLCFKKN